jgi:hypothetical protein
MLSRFTAKLAGHFRNPQARKSLRNRPGRFVLEQLEDRCLLAPISWTNPAGGFWDVGSNWSNGTGPGSADDAIIDQPGTITIEFRSGDVSVQSISNNENFTISGGSLSVGAAGTLGQAVLVGAGTTLTVSGSQQTDSLTVAGTITHPRGDLGGVNLQVATMLDVQAGGKIDVTAKGYLGARRSSLGETRGSNGNPTTAGGSFRQGGGSYGSLGGIGGDGGSVNAPYGSETAPTDLGSGGGAVDLGDENQGGNGGGRAQVMAGTVRIDGQLVADGGGGRNSAGGGSGGSINLVLTGGTFSGNGIIRAEGGGGGRFAGSAVGGLGRIAVVGFSSNNFTGTLGRAGTIFVQQSGTAGDLTLDSTTVTIPSGEARPCSRMVGVNAPSTFINHGTLAPLDDSLTLGNLVTLVQDGVVTGANRNDASIGSFTVQSGATVAHSRGLLAGIVLNVAELLDVQAGGKIDVTALGYRGGLRDGNPSATGETRGPDGAPTTSGGASGQGVAATAVSAASAATAVPSMPCTAAKLRRPIWVAAAASAAVVADPLGATAAVVSRSVPAACVSTGRSSRMVAAAPILAAAAAAARSIWS